MSKYRIVQYSASEYAIQGKKFGLWLYFRDGDCGIVNTYPSVEAAENRIKFWESREPLPQPLVVKEL